MAKQKYYIIIKADGDDFSVALEAENTRGIYNYLDNLVQQGRKWRSWFAPEAEVIKKFRPVQDEYDLWR